MGAGTGELERGRGADATRCAGDKYPLSLDIGRHVGCSTRVGSTEPARIAARVDGYSVRIAVNETHIEATPERIFEVLSHADNYGYWVVGAKHIRDADPGFPRPGTRFHHTVGAGPFEVKDHTAVLAADPPTFLKLRAKARPLGTAIVTLEITPEADGSHVRMTEDPADSLTAFVFNPLTHLLVRGRNVESLDRLAELAEGRAVAGSEPRPL